jgi:hypothetical protein
MSAHNKMMFEVFTQLENEINKSIHANAHKKINGNDALNLIAHALFTLRVAYAPQIPKETS